MKGCVPNHANLENILKFHFLYLTSVVIPRTLLTIKLGGFSKGTIWTSQLFERRAETRVGVQLRSMLRISTITTLLLRIIVGFIIFLYVEEQINKTFTPASFMSFRSGYSLRNHLVRGKIYFVLLKNQVWELLRHTKNIQGTGSRFRTDTGFYKL